MSSLDEAFKQIADLRREVERLKNITAPTVPIYDSENFPFDPLEGQVVIAGPVAAPEVCNFGAYSGHVADLDFANAAFLPNTARSEWYVTIQVWFPAATLTAWADHTANGNVSSGSILFLYMGNDPGIILCNESGNTLHWCKTNNAAASGSTAYTNRVALTSDHIEPDTCHTIGMHHTLTGVDYYIDGDIFANAYTFSTSAWTPDLLYVGAVAQTGPSYVNDVYYIDNLKVGTSGWGSSDLYSENFESGTIDSNWDNNGITVTAAPF